MKNKHLALFMAFIMCFSLMFGAAAATEGGQIMPSTTFVSPTQEKDFVDGIVDVLGSTAGDMLGQAGSEIENGIETGHSFLAMVQKVVENVKIFFANLINTIFPMFGIGSGNSIFG